MEIVTEKPSDLLSSEFCRKGGGMNSPADSAEGSSRRNARARGYEGGVWDGFLAFGLRTEGEYATPTARL